jgi:hypothetical protein
MLMMDLDSRFMSDAWKRKLRLHRVMNDLGVCTAQNTAINVQFWNLHPKPTFEIDLKQLRASVGNDDGEPFISLVMGEADDYIERCMKILLIIARGHWAAFANMGPWRFVLTTHVLCCCGLRHGLRRTSNPWIERRMADAGARTIVAAKCMI